VKRRCVISKSFSIILLTFILSIILIACSVPETKNQQETKSGTIQQEPAEEVEQPEVLVEEMAVSGLDFNSTSDDVVNQLGKPSEITSAPGVSIYYYREGSHKGVTVCFIEDKAFSFGIDKGDLTAPKGIKVGDNIIKALREYYIPQNLIALGISQDDTDGEMLQKIINRENHIIYLSDYENFKIELFFDLPSGTITSMNISQGKEANDMIQLEPSDFNASPKDIAEKFGYPDEIYIYNEYAFEFDYFDPTGSPGVMFLKDSSTSANGFSLLKNWIAPNNIKIGDTIHNVFEKLYIPDYLKNIGITSTMNNEEISVILNAHYMPDISFDLLTDYDISIYVDKTGFVRSVSVSKFDHPQYPVARSDGAFEVPVFDKDTIATKEDLYMSGCKFGSTRQEVFQLLGSPKNTEAGYSEYRDKYQDCYFENSVAYFLDIDEYGDLASGRAWYYYIKDPFVIGPRGLCVGDRIEKTLAVFPGSDDIDFKTITSRTAIYVSPDSPGQETNSASVYPSASKTNTGEVYINVDWVYGITFEYNEGIITGMTLSEMLD